MSDHLSLSIVTLFWGWSITFPYKRYNVSIDNLPTLCLSSWGSPKRAQLDERPSEIPLELGGADWTGEKDDGARRATPPPQDTGWPSRSNQSNSWRKPWTSATSSNTGWGSQRKPRNGFRNFYNQI